jgi:hypothetical protein
VLEAGEADHLDEPARGRFPFRQRYPLRLKTIENIPPYRQPGKQRIFLEDDAAIRSGAGNAPAVDTHLALGVDEAADDVEQGALATAGWADDRDEFAVLDGKVDPVQSDDRLPLVRIGFRNVPDLNRGHLAEVYAGQALGR